MFALLNSCWYFAKSVVYYEQIWAYRSIQLTDPQSTYIYRVQSSVWRLPNYWPPPPLSTQRVCPPPAPKAGATHSPGGEGSIVRKTPDIWLASSSLIPLRTDCSRETSDPFIWQFANRSSIFSYRSVNQIWMIWQSWIADPKIKDRWSENQESLIRNSRMDGWSKIMDRWSENQGSLIPKLWIVYTKIKDR